MTDYQKTKTALRNDYYEQKLQMHREANARRQAYYDQKNLERQQREYDRSQSLKNRHAVSFIGSVGSFGSRAIDFVSGNGLVGIFYMLPVILLCINLMRVNILPNAEFFGFERSLGYIEYIGTTVSRFDLTQWINSDFINSFDFSLPVIGPVVKFFQNILDFAIYITNGAWQIITFLGATVKYILLP